MFTFIVCTGCKFAPGTQILQPSVYLAMPVSRVLGICTRDKIFSYFPLDHSVSKGWRGVVACFVRKYCLKLFILLYIHVYYPKWRDYFLLIIRADYLSLLHISLPTALHLSATKNFWVSCGSLKVLFATPQDCHTK